MESLELETNEKNNIYMYVSSRLENPEAENDDLESLCLGSIISQVRHLYIIYICTIVYIVIDTVKNIYI